MPVRAPSCHRTSVASCCFDAGFGLVRFRLSDHRLRPAGASTIAEEDEPGEQGGECDDSRNCRDQAAAARDATDTSAGGRGE